MKRGLIGPQARLTRPNLRALPLLRAGSAILTRRAVLTWRAILLHRASPAGLHSRTGTVADRACAVADRAGLVLIPLHHALSPILLVLLVFLVFGYVLFLLIFLVLLLFFLFCQGPINGLGHLLVFPLLLLSFSDGGRVLHEDGDHQKD